jgi:predicted dehydrogenase
VRPFPVGVVGIGDISDAYLDNLKLYPDIVEVIGCAGRDLAKARRTADQHGLRRAHATAGELFADPDVDIVLDLTTPSAHAELNLAAIRAGKHVYTEKRLAATFEGSSR